MKTREEFITAVKERVAKDLKDHVLTEEVNVKGLKSYKYAEPGNCCYWMRIIETSYGIHLEGDIGVMQVCYKDLHWMAYSTSLDYMMSKLDHDLHKEETIVQRKVKNLVDDMKAYAYENRREKWERYADKVERRLGVRPKKVILYTEEEKEFFERMEECQYNVDTVETLYNLLDELGSFWQWTYDDGLRVTDYSWHTYFQFFALQHAALKIMESYQKAEACTFLG
jgi:hypothetical protein